MSDDASDGMDATASGVRVQARPGARGGAMQGFMASLSSAVKAANPHGGRMELYHWFPGVRFYLIVKQAYDLTDVDAIFKVNTLSSFTLGIYQLSAIMVTVATGRPISIYIGLNIA